MVGKWTHLLFANDAPVTVILEAAVGDLGLVDEHALDAADWVEPQLIDVDAALPGVLDAQIVAGLDLLDDVDLGPREICLLITLRIEVTLVVNERDSDEGDDCDNAGHQQVVLEKAHFSVRFYVD